MPAIYFHDLPIYLLSEMDYDEELRTLTHKLIPEPPITRSPAAKAADEDARVDLFAHYQRYFGKWRFNEVVGYVRLFIVHRHVQGTYFGRRVRETGPRHDEPITREVRTRTKIFRKGNPLLAARHIPPGSNNEQCLSIVNEYVRACSEALPRRHLDLEWLREVGPYVNWCAVADTSDL